MTQYVWSYSFLGPHPRASGPAGRSLADRTVPGAQPAAVGEVHDDNAWFAGAWDGHAGLFGMRPFFGSFDSWVSPVSGLFVGIRFLNANPFRHLHGEGKHQLVPPIGEEFQCGRYFSANTVGNFYGGFRLAGPAPGW